MNGLKFDMLMYPEHLENCLDLGHRLLIFFILVVFWLSETGQISGHFLRNAKEEWPQIWHVGVFWPSSEKVRFWSRYNDIPHFGAILTSWNRSNSGFLGIFFRTHGRNSVIFGTLMYSEHLWNWLHSGHGLVFFPILPPFWRSETGQMCSFQEFSWQCMGGINRNLSCSSLTCDISRNERSKF